MANLKERAISLLESTTAVDLNAAADTETELFNPPVGNSAIITHVVIHTLSASGASAVITLGKTGGTCDEWRGDQTLSALDGTTKYTTLYLDQSTSDTPEAGVLIVGGTDKLGVEITTAHGTAVTATFDVFGYLI